jgi:transposase
VLTLPPSIRIFLASAPTDMRKSFDGLTAVARDVIGEDPLSGHLFVFANRRRTRLKILVWDGSGMWVMAKRLEEGTFAWPDRPGSARVVVRHDELAALIGGLDISRATRRRWYRRDNHAEKTENHPSVGSAP